MAKEIKLTKGKVCLVDDENFAEMSKSVWHYDPKGARHDLKRMFMHRLLMGCPQRTVIHADGNVLNNQKSNLVLGIRCGYPKPKLAAVLWGKSIMKIIAKFLQDHPANDRELYQAISGFVHTFAK